MTEIEKFTRLVLDSVYTSLPCKVVSYDGATRFAKVSMMITTEKEGDGTLIRVPILRMVGGSVPLKPGMIIPVFFSKYSLGQFAVSLANDKVKPALECMQFSRDSAYGLPFLFDDKMSIAMPEFVEFDTKVIFKEEVVMEKTLDVDSTITTKSDLKATGKLSAANYDKHTHISGKEGQPTEGPSE
ncbi:MAG: hypothetical protein ACRCX2_27185 [Paraclostridium sp.]